MEERKWKTIEPGAWKPEKAGDYIEGVLVNKTPRDATKDIGARYHIESKDGMFFVWGSAILDDRMGYVQVGQYVRIEYKGQEDLGKGKKLNKYLVQVAENVGKTSTPSEKPEQDTGNKAESGKQPDPHDAIPVEQL